VSPPRGLPTGPRTPVLRPTPPRGPRHCSVAGHRPGHRGALCGARGPARAVCPLGGRPAAVRAVCKDLGAGVEVVVTDVLDDAQVERAVVAALARFGRLDVCVHVAGVSAYGHHTGTTADVFARVVSINLVGAANVARSNLWSCSAPKVWGTCGGRVSPGRGRGTRYGRLRGLQVGRTAGAAAGEPGPGRGPGHVGGTGLGADLHLQQRRRGQRPRRHTTAALHFLGRWPARSAPPPNADPARTTSTPSAASTTRCWPLRSLWRRVCSTGLSDPSCAP